MLAEKTAIITGASSGFGLLTSVTLARRGWRILATMRNLDRREQLESTAQSAGVLDRIEFHALDVTNAAQIAAMAATVAARPAPLHALINNAGFAMAGFAEDVSDAELRSQFDTNFFAAAAVSRAFLPLFRRQGFGHIVMVSSISGRMGFPGIGTYAASKFALEGWSETLRLEMKPRGIHVVLVEPGSFQTDIWTRNALFSERSVAADSLNAPLFERWRSRMDLTKLAHPQVVADGIAAIVENPHPRLRYIFGRDAKMAIWIRRLLPFSLLERILIRAGGLGGSRNKDAESPNI